MTPDLIVGVWANFVGPKCPGGEVIVTVMPATEPRTSVTLTFDPGLPSTSYASLGAALPSVEKAGCAPPAGPRASREIVIDPGGLPSPMT